MSPNSASRTETSPSTESSTPAPAKSGDGTCKAVLPPGYNSGSTRSASSSHDGARSETRSAKTPSLAVRLWRTIKSIYYASSPTWQFLKSGALLLFGLFCWSSANLLLSYQPDWHWPYFFMAYGFLLTPYGPFTHLVLVPHLIPWLRRRTRGSWLHALGRHLTLTSLTIFFTAVLWMGLYPPSFMQIDFRAASGTSTSTVNPALVCSSPETTGDFSVTCQLENTNGVGSIRVTSGGTLLLQRDEPPFSFSVSSDELVSVVGQRQFQVIVRDTENTPVRRFTRTVSMIR